MKITKSELRKLVDEIVDAAQDRVGDGYKITYQRGTYGNVGTVVIEIAKADKDGNILSGIAHDFRLNARFIGLEPEDLGAKFTTGGVTYKIVGLKTRNRKYPLIVKGVGGVDDGRQFKMEARAATFAKKLGSPHWTPAS